MTDFNDSEARPRSLQTRIAATLTAPRRLAHALRAHPFWPDALILTTLLAVIVAASRPEEVYLEQVENPVTRRGKPVEITSPRGDIVLWGRMLLALSAVASHPVIAFTLAGLLYLGFSLLGRGPATYRHYLALVSHALLIAALGSLLALPLQWLGADPTAGLTPAAFAPALARHGSALVGGLAAVDPFTVWMLVVLGIGVAALNGRRAAAVPVATLLGLYLLLLVGIAAAGA